MLSTRSRAPLTKKKGDCRQCEVTLSPKKRKLKRDLHDSHGEWQISATRVQCHFLKLNLHYLFFKTYGENYCYDTSWSGRPGFANDIFQKEPAVPWQPGEPSTARGCHQLGEGGDCPTLPCTSPQVRSCLTSGAGGSHTENIKLLENVQRRPRGWWGVWRGSLTRSSWGHSVSSAWGREDWGQTSLGSSASSWGAAKGQVQISSLSWPVTGLQQTAGAESGEV